MSKALCWIRRDIRLHDHAALSACTQNHSESYIVFIFDPEILEPIKKKSTADKRLQFIAESLFECGHFPIIRYGNPVDVIPQLIKELQINALYFNRDYSPYAQKRDKTVTEIAKTLGCNVNTFKDHVIWEPEEILNQSKPPFKIFTPYSKAWKTALIPFLPLQEYPVKTQHIVPHQNAFKSVKDILDFAGFEHTPLLWPGGTKAAHKHLEDFKHKLGEYETARDYPSVEGTSHLSVYIRHGCISIRELVNAATETQNSGSEKWLTELVWREFYQMVFHFYPDVNSQPFQEKFRSLTFTTNEDYLAAFKNGLTGFPIIDAAMRCLNQTGWMHNRLRMVTASFLTKILLCDWKRGERYFSWKLLDYELQSNNGGWQWAAGIGCDAAPYFRIFNPITQSQTYDPNGEFIREFCPELKSLSNKDIHFPMAAKQLPLSFQLGKDYPFPIVDYASQRKKCLEFFKT